MNTLLIFDFDGVIADSEVLANTVLAELVSELGVPTTLENACDRYRGKRISEVNLAIEQVLDKKLPVRFVDEFRSRTFTRFHQELQLVSGQDPRQTVIPMFFCDNFVAGWALIFHLDQIQIYLQLLERLFTRII